MLNIFISHSRQDDAFTGQVRDALESAGFDVWVDFDDMPAGQRWVQAIQRQIERCDAVLLVLSRASRDSEWVERETLYAMELKKPLLVAQIEAMPLPLHLINRQTVDCGQDAAAGIQRVVALFRGDQPTPGDTPLPPVPTQENFFKFLAQLPQGDAVARIARDLYDWGQENADRVAFGGKLTPGLHVRLLLNGDGVTLFTVWGFPRQPAVQVPFQYLSQHPPYNERALRLSTLQSLNRLLPDAPLLDDSADRRPTLPLPDALADADSLALFKRIMAEIIVNLHSV